jgi:hypothetical protein
MKSPRRDQVRWLIPSGAMLAAVLIGFMARDLWPKAAAQATANAAVPTSVATVVRTDVAQRQVVPGTLGYQDSFTVVNELPPGVLTWVPGTGQTIRRDHPLYKLANQTVTLWYGPVPAWRDIGPGMTPGPDVRELDTNLNVLGYDAGPPGDTFTWATEVAIERWQQARGQLVTGTIALGQVVFLPEAIRVTAVGAQQGATAGSGTQILSGSSTEPSVTLNLAPGGPAVRPGDQVLVTLPNGTSTVPGTVSTVGAVTTVPGGGGAQNGGSQNGGGQNGGTPSAAIPVVIRLSGYPGSLDQAPVQVTLTEQKDDNVLAVPVTALLAQLGGGYAVRTPTAPVHRLIPVTTGLYDDETGLIEVSGPGLTPGMQVQVGTG